jgi:hypothetical protein
MFKCPVCGDTDVRPGKTGLPVEADGRSTNLYDFFCQRCHTLESRRRDAPDFDAWYDRWAPAADPDPDARAKRN